MLYWRRCGEVCEIQYADVISRLPQSDDLLPETAIIIYRRFRKHIQLLPKCTDSNASVHAFYLLNRQISPGFAGGRVNAYGSEFRTFGTCCCLGKISNF